MITELGPLNCSSATGQVEKGQELMVLVRPDDLELAHDEEGQGSNRGARVPGR